MKLIQLDSDSYINPEHIVAIWLAHNHPYKEVRINTIVGQNFYFRDKALPEFIESINKQLSYTVIPPQTELLMLRQAKEEQEKNNTRSSKVYKRFKPEK